jgi:ribonucleoside-triphosphate reductase
MSKNKEDFMQQLCHAMQLVLKAHQEKRRFISYLMSAPDMPLWEIGRPSLDGHPYIDLSKATYIVGLIGLNEAVQVLCGKELHQGEKALTLGLEIILHMKEKVDEFSEKTGLHFALEETPAESAARRLALIDLRTFDKTKDFVRGNIEKNDVYWTNSIHIRPDAEVSLLERIQTQSKFHPLIESGAITHAFVGEHLPPAKSIFNLVEKTFRLTKTTQLTISPEFTICLDCQNVSLGLGGVCPKCGSVKVDHITRIVGYFSRTSGWNKSKIAELEDRRKGDYRVCQ